MKDFYGFIPFFPPPKKTVAKERDLFDFGQSVFLPVFDSYAMALSFDNVVCLLLHKFQFLGFFAVLYLYIDKKKKESMKFLS